MPSWLSQRFDNHCCPHCEGTVLTTSIHIITSVIGVGVLSLAWATAQLGWIAGPITMLLFSLVTCYTSQILAACFRPEDNTYMDVVTANLGGFKVELCGLVECVTVFGAAVSYTIASSIRLANIERPVCFHKHGVQHACPIKRNRCMIAVGIIEILLSQILPSDHPGWISLVAAVMSLCYSSIEVFLGIAKIKATRKIRGSLTGISTSTVTPTQKLWGWLQALGVMAFAYEYFLVFPEILGTIQSTASRTMKKASLVSIPVATLVYMLSGCIGFAVSGNMVPRNLLTEFGFYDPYWLASIADGTLVIHLIGAFQVYCQPLFTFVENKVKTVFGLGPYKLFFFKLVWRTVFVIASTLTSLLLPFFIDIIGLLGALNLWLLTVYFPVQMYIKKENILNRSTKWVLLQILSVVCFIVSVAAAAGSIAGFVHDLKSYKPFTSGF
ncbi:amino acid permease 3 [Eucalyptus grandis]|uniref:amino acid permease 3 n=1 Tax=Eucalyptus grandis TaxID=71139 RepID=UPI00192EE102|nr:amino acid permease 3 [Eucalyptus grandis]